MPRVLVVCSGNLCRSPIAQSIGTALARQQFPAWRFDSAGTHALLDSPQADPRAKKVLLEHGFPVARHRTRNVVPADFELFDLVWAMDRSNLVHLERLAPVWQRHKLALFMAGASKQTGCDVPDPYYGDYRGFVQVLRLCETTLRERLSIS